MSKLARIKKQGITFEISIDSDKAIQFKENSASLREVLLSDEIYTDAKKGLIAKDEDLQKAFETTDKEEIAKIILTKGEIQVSAEHRAEERKQKLRKLINIINVNAVAPKTGLPHPATRIELALEQGKVSLDYNKTVEEQLDDIIKKLRPIIPISIQKKVLVIKIPAQYTGKAYSLKTGVNVMKEEWANDGSWLLQVELPAGLVEEFSNKVNSITHGEGQIVEK